MYKQKRTAISKIWAKALGEKAEENADTVALVRTLLITQAIITNILISINIIINWLYVE